MRPISGPSSMMATAAQALTGAATQIGLVGEDGPRPSRPPSGPGSAAPGQPVSRPDHLQRSPPGPETRSPEPLVRWLATGSEKLARI